MSAFSGVQGGINCTHILALVPASQKGAYHNQKGDILQNILADCSLVMYFFYVCTGWEGLAHDARIFENAKWKGFSREGNAIYPGDPGYGLRRGFLIAYDTV